MCCLRRNRSPISMELARIGLSSSGLSRLCGESVVERFAQAHLLCDSADAARGKDIEFRGTPGATVTLSWGVGGGTLSEIIGSEGVLRLALSRLMPAITGDRLAVMIGGLDNRVPCFTVVGAPIGHHISVGLESSLTPGVAIGGQVALDRSVDSLQVIVERSRQPWIPQERIDLQGFARSWELHCALAAAEYELTLLANLDGKGVSVLDAEGKVWSRTVGHAYASRDPFDSLMYDALCAHEDAIERIGRHPASRIRAIERSVSVLALTPSAYELPIRLIYSSVGEHMRVGELSALSSLPAGDGDGIERLAAVSGLPIAAAPSLRTIQIGSLPLSKGVTDIFEMDFLNWLLDVAKSAESTRQAAGVVNTFADDPLGDDLRRAYASFLRLTVATDLMSTLERLEDEIERPVIARARLEASDIIVKSGLPLNALLRLEPVGSLFAKWVSALWVFAFVSRLAPAMPPNAFVPKGAALISRWLYDRALGHLARSALARAQALCANALEGANAKTC